MVARLGGDEFAVVVQAHDAASTAAVVAERILSSLQQTIAVEETAVHIDCSIGIALGAPQSASAEQLLRNADIAMYTAKSRGKHCFELFDRSMHRSMLSHIELKEDLARAVERDELELHYQPIIDLASRTVLGFEALVRWRHPTRGLLPPPEFIGLAEETGDIVAIGGWVINQACQDLARFRATSGQPKLWMAVNVSARQLMADALNEVVREALHRHDIDGASLILEITEQAVITDTERACRILTQLRAEGVKVAIDDFGTGFSSLGSLRALPVDIIKIDRSFVADNGINADPAVMLEAIVTLGQGLGVELIAEGIENDAELDRLRRLGCTTGQGYLIARPMPADQALDFAQPRSRNVGLAAVSPGEG
jgi:predicted signal transduction protein with EAL and GGDEF domain